MESTAKKAISAFFAVYVYGVLNRLLSQGVHIALPFRGQQIAFLGVAFLAAGNQIEFFRLPAPANRYNMIHGQLGRRKTPLAIVTDPGGSFPLPPLTCPYFPGTGPLLF